MAIFPCLAIVWWCARGRSAGNRTLVALLGFLDGFFGQKLINWLTAILFLGAAIILELRASLRTPRLSGERMREASE